MCINLVGPITSLVLGVLFLVIGYANVNGAAVNTRQALSRMDPLATMFYWLGPVNLLLAGFNMIPGFPLDGGRVLRAILWKTSGSMRTGVRSRCAQGSTSKMGGGFRSRDHDAPLEFRSRES